MIQLIHNNQILDKISTNAKKWFFDKVLNGNAGPFRCETINATTKNIILELEEPVQKGLF